jgi:hypothetical protein
MPSAAAVAKDSIRAFLVAALLAGCGGGDPEPTEIVAPVQPPREVSQEVQPIVEHAPVDQWKQLWREDWTTTVFGGYVRHNLLRCNGQQADPNLPRGREAQLRGSTWSFFGSGGNVFWIEGGALRVNAQGAGAVLGWQTFDHTKPLRVEAPVTLEQREGAWIGLTLIQDESDYREISLQWDRGRLYVELYAPCYAKRLAEVEPGERLLSLAYDPAAGWTYSVDQSVVHFEPIDNLGATLVGSARVGIYAHVHQTLPGVSLGPAVATVGAVTVYQQLREQQ